MTDPPKPRRKRRIKRVGRVVWIVLDKYLVVVSAGLVVGVWLVSDWAGLPLSEGSKAALSAFLGYAVLKQKSDDRWKDLEIRQRELQQLVERLETMAPGTPEALATRRELVELARRADGGHDHE